MPIKLYSYKNCSTCKKATKFLDAKGLSYDEIDITSQPPKISELEQMLAAYEGQVKKLFNTSGQMYRELELGKKLATMSDKQAIDLLARHGKLVKRPFLIKDGRSVAVGFKEDTWKSILR